MGDKDFADKVMDLELHGVVWSSEKQKAIGRRCMSARGQEIVTDGTGISETLGVVFVYKSPLGPEEPKKFSGNSCSVASMDGSYMDLVIEGNFYLTPTSSSRFASPSRPRIPPT